MAEIELARELAREPIDELFPKQRDDFEMAREPVLLIESSGCYSSRDCSDLVSIAVNEIRLLTSRAKSVPKRTAAS